MSRLLSNLRAVLALLFAVALTFGLGACDDSESAGPEVSEDVEDVREEDDDLGADDVGADFDFDDEGDFAEFENEAVLGQRVTVSAEVAEIYSPSILSIAGEGGAQPVLVVMVDPALVTEAVTDNAVIRVTGTVAEMIEVASLGDFETEFGDEFDFGFDAEDEGFFESDQLDQFEGDHFLVGTKIDVLDATEDGADEEDQNVVEE